jgi:hypothetical protein
MRITTVPSKKRKQLTIIGILLLGIPLVVFASLQVTQWLTRASSEPEPNNILFTNVGTQEFTVTWVTEVNAMGSVIPILNDQDGTPIVDTRGAKRRRTHHVTMRALEPNTNYNFMILLDEERYGEEEGEETFSFRTPPVASTSPAPNPVSGSVNGVSNEDAIVFVSTRDSDVYPVSSVVSKGDIWNVDLSSLRRISDGSYIVVRDSDELVIVVVSGLNRGGFVRGTYGELFDSNGVLKEVHTLNVEDMDDPYSNLDPTTLSQPRRDVPVTPIVDDDVDDFDDFDLPDLDEPISTPTTDRRFRIVEHVEWIDLTTVEGLTATGGMREESVEVVNITDTDFTVMWISRQKEEGYIKYGTSSEALTNEVSDERDGLTTRREYYVHYVPVSRLQPELDYYFEIYSGDEVYDNGGQKYTVRTFPKLTSPPPFESVAGTIEGLPDHNEAVVTVYMEDADEVGSPGKSSRIASLVDERGRWILSISDIRTEDGLSYFEYTSEDSAKFDLLTTIPVETHVEKVQGIGNRDVEILLEGSSVLGADDTEIGLLSNYGILGYSSGAHLPADDVDPIDQDYEVTSQIGSQTPKTGIFDNLFYIIILSLVLIVVPSSMYIIHVTRKRRKGTMIKNL